jgi:pyruvate dehydrogenase E1 component alpha subunit
MAKLWKLPVIYVIENNRTPWARRRALVGDTELLATRQLLSHPGEQVDGMDVRAVKAAGEKRRSTAAPARGRYILEMLTYRYRGHSMSDPAKYRTKDEVQKMREEHDPIEQVKRRLLELKHASEDDLKAIDKESATSSPTPPTSPRTIRSPIRPSSGPTLRCKGRDHHAD